LVSSVTSPSVDAEIAQPDVVAETPVEALFDGGAIGLRVGGAVAFRDVERIEGGQLGLCHWITYLPKNRPPLTWIVWPVT
jgi:hypothetical protein